ncbi:hypothetical protein BKA62DRAFT_668141 [Auriculariales sp. MPI-PUGE-AT-0066]|nr:hypothetical protein BKA62DRAFT_668141 [Auriculariales sp. MPI-PUGE-AT-0066]
MVMEPETAWSGVRERLQSYEPLIRQFLQDDITHPEWSMPHECDGAATWPRPADRSRIEQLRMLKFGEQNRPDMLLYGLGHLEQVDTGFAERFKHLMSSDEHTVLLNASGTGKTRMVFEILSRVWGLYFTCASDKQTPYGSSDLAFVLAYLRGTALGHHWSTWQQPLAQNIRRARHAFNGVIASRLLIFRLFCDLVESLHIEESIARRKWLLLQLRSDVIFGSPNDDLFDRLRLRISPLDPALVEKCIKSLTSSPCTFTLSFVAIDEANVASGMHQASYAMSDGKTLAPVLREIMCHFSSTFPTQRLLVSGTRIDMNIVQDALGSGKSKQSRARLVCALGSFDTLERTRHYLNHFLGPLSKAKVTRMHSWFQGRHRFLANCVEHMLMLGLSQLDAFIQMAVVSLTGYDINNVEWELERLYSLIRQDFELSGSFAARQLREALFAYALRNQQSKLWSNVQDYVSLGLALLDDDTTHASIWEPLVFYRLLTWIDNGSESSRIERLLKQQLNSSLRISHSLSSISGIASYFFRLHAPSVYKQVNLADYLDFQGAIPGWAAATAEIILPPCIRSGNIRIKHPVAFSITAANCPEDVLHWMRGSDHPFLIPDDDLGADLLFFLRLKQVNLGPTAIILVTLQLSKSSRFTRHPATIVPIQPSMFYLNATHHRNTIMKTIKSLPNLPTNLNRAGSYSYSMLRIINCAKPFRPPTGREPPVACLQVDALLQGSHEPELDASYLQRARQKGRYDLEVVDVS